MIWIYSQRAIGHIAGMCATLAPNPNPNPNPHGHPHENAAPPRLQQWQWEINIIEKRFQACALLSLYLSIHSVNFCCSEFLLTELIISPHKFFGYHFFEVSLVEMSYRKWKMASLYAKLLKYVSWSKMNISLILLFSTHCKLPITYYFNEEKYFK